MSLSFAIVYTGFIVGTIGGIFIVLWFSKFSKGVGNITKRALLYLQFGVILNFLGWFFQVPQIDNYLHLFEIHDILMFLQTIPFLLASREFIKLVIKTKK